MATLTLGDGRESIVKADRALKEGGQVRVTAPRSSCRQKQSKYHQSNEEYNGSQLFNYHTCKLFYIHVHIKKIQKYERQHRIKTLMLSLIFRPFKNYCENLNRQFFVSHSLESLLMFVFFS